MRKMFLLFFLCALVAANFTGRVVRSGQWDNYGHVVKVFNAAREYTALTSVNGKFSLNILPDQYELSVADKQGRLIVGAAPLPPSPYELRLPGEDADGLLFPLINLTVTAAILLLTCLVRAIKRSPRSDDLLFLALSFALYTATDAAQDLLAWGGLETLAGTLFFLKHIGSAWFGYLFFRYWRADCHGWLWLAPLSESLVLGTWPLFGTDSAFERFWFFSFTQLRLLIMLQLIVFVLAGVLTVFCEWRCARDVLRKNILALTQSIFILLILLLLVLVIWPLVGRQGAEFFDRQYLLTSLVFGLIFFVWLSCAEIYQYIFQAQLRLARQESLTALGRLASGLAHEIKNPLAALSNLVSLLPRDYRKVGFLREFMDIVPRQIERINALLANLLNLSRPASGQKVSFDLGQILAQSVVLLTAQAQQQAVIIEQISAPRVRFRGDPRAIEQVFLNLGLNALQAMPRGGRLKITLTQKKTVIFQDSGRGISPEVLPQIFDPFFTTKKSGAGLGLSIVKKILDEHKVKITLASKPRRGTEVKLFF
ncbi:putative signal histidine kinase [Candidatus Termititenax persephonae]|uniref:histidine kinase n=1 Tax=Candidatus Termititenax persephonae TaxID=2218525 RepID=A0A388TFH3_9BACT|nr:putative signal histidine kinase [Candidatus Termititenax persephonae]